MRGTGCGMGIACPCGMGYFGRSIQGYSYDILKGTVFITVCIVLPIPSSPAEKEIRILYHTDPSLSVCQGGLFRFRHA